MFRVLLCIFTLLFGFEVRAFERDVAVLWDSSESEAYSYTFSLVHRKLEVMLNHYGFKAHYFDVHDEQFRTQNVNPKEFYALVTWFSDDQTKNVKNIRKVYRSWFSAKKKVISLGQMGIYYDENEETYDLKDINNTLKLAGLEYEDHQYETPLGLKIEILGNQKDFEFERSYKFEVPAVKVFKSIDNKNKTLVKIKDSINHRTSPAVLQNEHFFMATMGADLFYNPIQNYSQWRVSPFYIMKWLQADPLEPIPDTTTINGKRIYYGHVDGDAFINISDIDRTSISGKILLDRILEKYKLPTTASFVVAEIDPKDKGKSNFTEIAKEIASKDYIELASHTYYHPLSWNKKPSKYDIEAYLDKPEDYKGGPILAYKPRDNKLDYEREIKSSIDYINTNIAPKNKPTNLLLWSGSCEPPYEAMKVIEKYGYLNLNGGDSRFDNDLPSYSHLLPLYRQVQDLTQYYSSNTNEILYTHNWTGPFSGFIKVLETFKNTESPVRMKPINIYYHFYSAEKHSALNALDAVYKWTSEQDIFPIFASEYPQILKGFIDTKVSKIKENRYKLQSYGKLRTFRIDQNNVYPDYKNSKNIIGHRQINDSLYVFLGDAPESQLSLTTTMPSEVYLSTSDFNFSTFQLSENSLKVIGTSKWRKSFKLHVDKRKIKFNKDVEIVAYVEGYVTIKLKDKSIDTTIEFVQ